MEERDSFVFETPASKAMFNILSGL
jgi:hypothetical protein